MENDESSRSKFESFEKQEIFRALYLLLDKVGGDSKIPLTRKERKIIQLLLEDYQQEEDQQEESLESLEGDVEKVRSNVVELFD